MDAGRFKFGYGSGHFPGMGNEDHGIKRMIPQEFPGVGGTLAHKKTVGVSPVDGYPEVCLRHTLRDPGFGLGTFANLETLVGWTGTTGIEQGLAVALRQVDPVA